MAVFVVLRYCYAFCCQVGVDKHGFDIYVISERYQPLIHEVWMMGYLLLLSFSGSALLGLDIEYLRHQRFKIGYGFREGTSIYSVGQASVLWSQGK